MLKLIFMTEYEKILIIIRVQTDRKKLIIKKKVCDGCLLVVYVL